MIRYTRNFYEGQRDRSRLSAQEIVPLVTELVRPASVVDVGCGSGAWLSIFQEQGVADIFGMDGPWVDPKTLFIPAERFAPTDLSRPIMLERTFDLAISLEVAEHIPADKAPAFVESLTKLGPVILFSAAIPGQGGTHHVNEQWPDYWVRLFKDCGYDVVDCLRKKVWQKDNVEWWYAQNLLLFVRMDRLDRYPLLRRELESTGSGQLCLVHPKQYLLARDVKNAGLWTVLSALPSVAARQAAGLLQAVHRRIAGKRN